MVIKTAGVTIRTGPVIKPAAAIIKVERITNTHRPRTLHPKLEADHTKAEELIRAVKPRLVAVEVIPAGADNMDLAETAAVNPISINRKTGITL